jgi:hypothetical protein
MSLTRQFKQRPTAHAIYVLIKMILEVKLTHPAICVYTSRKGATGLSGINKYRRPLHRCNENTWKKTVLLPDILPHGSARTINVLSL